MKNKKKKIVCIIPARYASSRLPGKILRKVNNKTIIQMVYENVMKSKLINEVYIAGDTNLVRDEVLGFTPNYIETSEFHKSGSDRIIEAAENIEADIVVNVQGDEPFLTAEHIDLTIKPMLEDTKIQVTSAATKIRNVENVNNPNRVKVVLDKNNFALYFSRSIIPNPFGDCTNFSYLKHIGIYVYQKNFLMNFSNLKYRMLEKTENLEQLRILESGYQIYISIIDYNGFGIDTIEDFRKLEEILTT